MLASPALELSASRHCELPLVLWTPLRKCYEKTWGDRKETHMMKKLLQINSRQMERPAFFLVFFFFSLKYGNSALQLLDSTCAWWSISEWMGEKASDSSFTLSFLGGQINQRMGCNYPSLHMHLFPPSSISVFVFLVSYDLSTNGHMVLSTHSLSKILSFLSPFVFFLSAISGIWASSLC